MNLRQQLAFAANLAIRSGNLDAWKQYNRELNEQEYGKPPLSAEDKVDAEIMQFLPAAADAGHMFFDGIVYRFRENRDWHVDKREGKQLVHDSLKRLKKAGKVIVRSHPNSPLFYART